MPDRAAKWQPTLFEKVWLLGKEFAGGGSTTSGWRRLIKFSVKSGRKITVSFFEYIP